MSLPLFFDRSLLIHNWRLAVLYFAILIGIILLIVTKALLNEAWFQRVPVFGEAVISIRNLHDQALVQDEWASFAQSPVCTSTADYDYARQGDASRVYIGNSCLPPCGAGAAGLGACVSAAEAVIEQTSRLDTFLVSHFQDSWVDNRGRSIQAPEQHFAPHLEALSISLDYYFYPSGVSVEDAKEELLTSRDVETVILFRDGSEDKVNKIFRKDEDIVLSVQEVLDLAGVSLDTIQSSAGVNAHDGAAFPGGPVRRMAGVELLLRIDCFDWLIVTAPAEVPLCYVVVEEVGSIPWVEDVRRFQNAEGGFRERVNHGINLRTMVQGQTKKVNINFLYFEACAAMVYLRIPTGVVVIFAGVLVGQLSVLYRRAMYKDFSLVDQSTGVVLRWILNKSGFQNLQDMHGGGQAGISKAKMQVHLQEMLAARHRQLDEAETRHLLNFCFRAIAETQRRHSEKDPAKSGYFCRKWMRRMSRIVVAMFEELKEATGCHRSSATKFSQSGIDLDSFLLACSVQDIMDFNDVVKLFQSQRPVTGFERHFQPLEFKNMMRDCERDEEDTEVYTAEAENQVDESDELRLAPMAARLAAAESGARQLDEHLQNINEALHASNDAEADEDLSILHVGPDERGFGFSKLANRSALKRAKERKKMMQKGLEHLRQEVEQLASTAKALEERADVVAELKEALGLRISAVDKKAGRVFERNEDLFERLADVEHAQIGHVEAAHLSNIDQAHWEGREHDHADFVHEEEQGPQAEAPGQSAARGGSVAQSAPHQSLPAAAAPLALPLSKPSLRAAQITPASGEPQEEAWEEDKPDGFMLASALQTV